MRKVNPLNPYNEAPGLWGGFRRVLWTFMGPAAIGIGRPEAPYVPPVDPRCPLCAELLADHVIERSAGRTPTRLHCPSAAA